MENNKCAVYKGKMIIELLGSDCPFCNGTGEHNNPAKTYIDSHICQCIFLDRKQCPLCQKRCHNDTPNKPKILLSPE